MWIKHLILCIKKNLRIFGEIVENDEDDEYEYDDDDSESVGSSSNKNDEE